MNQQIPLNSVPGVKFYSGVIDLTVEGISEAATNSSENSFICSGIVLIPVSIVGAGSDPSNMDFEDTHGNAISGSVSPGFSGIISPLIPCCITPPTGDVSVIIPPGGTININNPTPAQGIYTPAFLTGSTGATTVIGTWQAVTNGGFNITLDGENAQIASMDFSGVSTMNDVAGVIQTALQTIFSTYLPTVVWTGTHFIISSTNPTSASAISFLSTYTGGATPTDISGAGGTAFIDADSAHGTITAAVPQAITYTALANFLGFFI